LPSVRSLREYLKMNAVTVKHITLMRIAIDEPYPNEL
jgi:hypothetical protein